MTLEKFLNPIIKIMKNNVPAYFSQTAFLGLNEEIARKVEISL